MKKFLATVLTIAMVLSIAGSALALTMSSSAAKQSLSAGEEISIVLSLDEAVETGCLQLYYKYDQDKFEFVNGVWNGDYPNQTLTDSKREPGNIKVTTYDLLATVNGMFTIAAGELCTLNFKAKADIENAAEAGFGIDARIEKTFFTDAIGDKNIPCTFSSVLSIDAAEPAVDGYTAAISAPEAVTVGESVAAKINVTNSNALLTAFNTAQLSINYDAQKLEYVSVTGVSELASVTVNEGVISIIEFGEDKNFGDAFTINFTAKAPGDAAVTLSSAKFATSDEAIVGDAQVATITNGTATITIGGYPVNLPEGFSGAGTAEPNEDYTFGANDTNYDYTFNATMGEETVEVVDNDDGTYTIEGVDGAINVTVAEKTPKSFAVTVEGNGAGDVTAESTATYGTNYTFTINKAARFAYDVSATIGGTAYTPTFENNEYTIQGASIVADVVITVNKTQTEAVVTFEGSGSDDVANGLEQAATIGQPFTFTINAAEGYSYVVKIGEDELVAEDGIYTIPADKISANGVTVSVEKAEINPITVEVNEYVKLDGKSIYLVTAVKNSIEEGMVLAYDGTTMFYSTSYNAYCYLVISQQDEAAVKAQAEEAIAVATATATQIAYDGDVNLTGVVDVNDAQLVYNIYNARYDDFATVSMEKFLSADLDGNKTVKVNDAQAVIAKIS